MATYTNILRLTKQTVGENPDTWGTVLNSQVFDLLESAVSGLSNISVTSGDVTTTTANGASDQSRMMIFQITGAPGIARNVNVPALSKVYLVNNKTTGGFTITIKTAAGSGVALPANKPTWVYCDGTNVLGAQNATTADSATNVTTTINSIVIAEFARLTQVNQWDEAQYSAVQTLTDGASIAIDMNSSNKFRVVLAGTPRALANPTNPHQGMSFEILVVQDAVGSRVLTYGTAYRFPGNVAPVLTTTPLRADLLTFSYDITSTKYLGSIVQNYTMT